MRRPSNDQRALSLQRTRLVPGLGKTAAIVDELNRSIHATAKKLGVTESELIEKIGKRFNEPRS